MSSPRSRNQERSFGLSVGLFLALMASVLWWHGRVGRAELLGSIGALLAVFGLVAPALLRGPSVWWWRFSRVLGHANARVLLTLFFFLVLTPIGLLWRLAGKDPLGRRRSRWLGWTPYPERYRDPKHYARMF